MIIDRIDPRNYNQFRNAYHRAALTALEPLRKAEGYEPRLEVIPDMQHVSLAKGATWDHRVSVRPGSWLWALSGSSERSAGFSVQITDFSTRRNLFSGPVSHANITGQGTASAKDATGATVTLSTPLHILPTPRPIVEPGLLNVQLSNLDLTNANDAQLVLWIYEPPAEPTTANPWNAELAREVALWRRLAATAAVLPADEPRQQTPHVDTALSSPAHTIGFTAGEAYNIIVPAASGLRIAIHQLSLYNAVSQQTISYLNGTVDLRGPLYDFGAGGSDYLPYQQEPHWVLDDGLPFAIGLAPSSGGDLGAVTGFVKYRLLKTWTPGQ